MVGLSEAMADCHSAVPRLTSDRHRAPGFLIKNKVLKCDTVWRLLFSTQTCQNSHATHMRMQQDSPHGFQRARPFCNNNRQACHLPRAYCAKRVLGYSSLSSSSLNSFIVFVAKIETHNFLGGATKVLGV